MPYSLENLINYFNKLYTNKPDTYQQRIDSFSEIISAIAGGDVTETQLAINKAYRKYNKGKVRNRYATYLRELSAELNNVEFGINHLQEQLQHLEIINFTNSASRNIELVDFSSINNDKVESLSPARLQRNSSFSTVMLKHNKIDFLKKEIEEMLESLQCYLEKAKEKITITEKSMATPDANTVVTHYVKSVIQQHFQIGLFGLGLNTNIELTKNKMAIAENLQANLLELTIKKFKKISVDDLAITVGTYLLVATEQNQELTDAASANEGELGKILDQALEFLKKYYPKSLLKADDLYAEYAAKKNNPST